jgi:PAS domain S-box-containing protein
MPLPAPHSRVRIVLAAALVIIGLAAAAGFRIIDSRARGIDPVLESWQRAAIIEGAVLLLTIAVIGALAWVAFRRDGRLREAQSAIAEREAERTRLVTAIEQTPASVVITDTDGRIEYVNPAFTRVTGYGLGEVLGQSPRLLKTGHTSDEEYQAMWAALKAGSPWSTVFLNKRKDGSTYWEQAQISPVRDASGAVTGFIAVKENITERIRSDEMIRGLNQRLQSILDAASEVAIIATDAEGLITTFNRGAEQMLGYSASDMVDRCTPAVFHLPAEIATRAQALSAELGIAVEGFQAFTALAARQGHDSREWTYVRRDGSHVPVSLVVTPVRGDDQRIAGYLGVAIDIGQRKQMEARLIEANRRLDNQARELGRANEELSQFAYVASHDLRQPLRMVSSYLTLIERRLQDHLDSESQSYFAFAVDGAKRMDGLIRGLLEYSRVGRNGEAFAPVSLAAVVASAVQVLSFSIADIGAQVVVAADLPTIDGDEQELQRLIGNLLGNALKYRAEDRPLRVEVAWKCNPEEITLWIRDNGMGMDPKDHDRAFGMFQRLVGREAIEGTGIGLAICRKITEHHGGRMWIESELNAGCTFFVTLPRRHDGKDGAA